MWLGIERGSLRFRTRPAGRVDEFSISFRGHCAGDESPAYQPPPPSVVMAKTKRLSADSVGVKTPTYPPRARSINFWVGGFVPGINPRPTAPVPACGWELSAGPYDLERDLPVA